MALSSGTSPFAAALSRATVVVHFAGESCVAAVLQLVEVWYAAAARMNFAAQAYFHAAVSSLAEVYFRAVVYFHERVFARLEP
mmetsp:Transcript_14340/g.35821  ORF Transcript_14340/g.35821 Transcript_14340/m.35821 type:complete len:83 (-) Transcript_14340:146-394(-)|eukprot:CAMPEP_0184393480 /NCGR_PEP_ID=MMETSP0007-20130409/34763_1 /TAXON_ID=97485 /ORGANISM="Prymnesium parvum, Strain Texoma1" /LENGTH=82 /DNA_ID=CAMNT_0026744491 /DNA_START=462 /DNA_END=710 /DNA_ORIENTATION=-